MLKGSRYYAVAAILLAIAGVPATAQFPTGPDDQDQPASKAKSKKAAEPGSPSINGNWSGELNQVGSQSPYKVELTINARGAETR